MIKKYAIPVILLAIVFNSCDPGFAVIISNKSTNAKNIKAIYPTGFKFARKDSLRTYAADETNLYQNPMIIPILYLDTVTKSYSFVLQAGRQVTVEASIGAYPTYGQMFIINNRDTAILQKESGNFATRKRHSFGGVWIYTIK